MTACTGASGRTGTKYSYAQLEGLWINAGGSKALAPVMAAIAEAESSGCSAAYNSSGASGLWQVEPSNAQYVPGGYGNIFSPADNAKAAVGVYKAQGLDAWQTYTNGAYKAFVSGGTTPDTNVAGSPATTAAASASGCVISVPLVGTCLFTKTEARALIGGLILAAGGVTCFIGLSVLVVSAFSHTAAGRAAGKAVGGAAEAGGAAAALAGFPEIGAPIAAAGSAVRSHSKSAPTKAGKVASGARTRSRQNASEDAELQARGASDIAAARKPPGTLRKSDKPGVKTGSIPAGRYDDDKPPF